LIVVGLLRFAEGIVGVMGATVTVGVVVTEIVVVARTVHRI
jgi:hypothetical protein